MRGQSHTMGGHILAPGGFLIDTKYLNSMHCDPTSQTVSVGPGATWGDLIKYLNDFGMSPMIMQVTRTLFPDITRLVDSG